MLFKQISFKSLLELSKLDFKSILKLLVARFYFTKVNTNTWGSLTKREGGGSRDSLITLYGHSIAV